MQGYAKSRTGRSKARRWFRSGIRQKKTVQRQYAVSCLLQHDKGAKTVHAAAYGHGHGIG